MSAEITIDIETLPDLRPGARDAFIEAAKESFKAPSGLTKEQAASDLGFTDAKDIKFTSKDSMIALWTERFKEEKAPEVGDAEWRKTSFDGLAGQLCIIGIAVDDEAPISLAGDESNMLDDFRRILTDVVHAENMGQPTFIGHNLIDFDLPFLFHRCVMLGIEPHPTMPVMPSRYTERVYDTMTRWAGFNNRIKLDTLARALGVGGKGDIDGSMVYDYYAAGRIDELKTYCANDVEMTRVIYRRMTFQRERLVA